MTAPLLSSVSSTIVGRRLRDCDDGEILIVVAVDDDGDFIVVDEAGHAAWTVPQNECHEGADHLPLRLYSDGLMLACFRWLTLSETAE